MQTEPQFVLVGTVFAGLESPWSRKKHSSQMRFFLLTPSTHMAFVYILVITLAI